MATEVCATWLTLWPLMYTATMRDAVTEMQLSIFYLFFSRSQILICLYFMKG